MTNADFVNLMKNLPDDLEVFVETSDGSHNRIQWAAKDDHFNNITIKIEPIAASMSADRTIWVDPRLLAQGENPEDVLEQEIKKERDEDRPHPTQLPSKKHDEKLVEKLKTDKK